MIAAAQRPVIYAGGGVIHSGAAEILRHIAELTMTPVTTRSWTLGVPWCPRAVAWDAWYARHGDREYGDG